MNRAKWHIRLLIASILMLTGYCSFGQGPTDSLPGDPGAISVYTIQDLSFGAFTQGATGGTVIVNTAGARSVTGTVLPLNMGVFYYQAIFEIDAPEGSIISIMNGPDATLTGSNGGTMSLKLGASSPGSPFVTTVEQPLRTPVYIGGTLTVGDATAAPPGNYTGSFYVTFNQE